MGEGGVRAGDQDQVGGIDVLIGAGWSVRAERLLVACHRRGHAQARVGVDVVRPDQALGELVEDVVILGQQLPGDVEGHGVRAVRRDDLTEFPGSVLQGLVPAGPLAVDLGIKQARTGVGGQVQRRALGAQAPLVSRVRGVALDGKDAVLVHRHHDAAADAAVAAGGGHLLARLDDHPALLDPRGINGNPRAGVLDAASGEQAEMLLVDGRSDDQLALQVADDAARQDVRARDRVVVAYRMDAVVGQPEDGHLLAIHERGHARVGDDVLKRADADGHGLTRLQVRFPAPPDAPAGSARAR